MPFPWVYFLPKNSGAECQFLRKILMHGNILPGNRPNFFVEHKIAHKIAKSKYFPNIFNDSASPINSLSDDI